MCKLIRTLYPSEHGYIFGKTRHERGSTFLNFFKQFSLTSTIPANKLITSITPFTPDIKADLSSAQSIVALTLLSPSPRPKSPGVVLSGGPTRSPEGDVRVPRLWPYQTIFSVEGSS